MDSEYKEGREYVLPQFIKQGSYGEVHVAEDVNTGFRFAVKKVSQRASSLQSLVRSVPLLTRSPPLLTDSPEVVHQRGGGYVECPQISSCAGTLRRGQRGAVRFPPDGLQIW